MKTEIGPLIDHLKLIESKNGSMNPYQQELLYYVEEKISETCFDKTVLINPKFSDKVSRMEIFGPVVNIYSYDDFDKAIEIANDTNVSF